MRGKITKPFRTQKAIPWIDLSNKEGSSYSSLYQKSAGWDCFRRQNKCLVFMRIWNVKCGVLKGRLFLSGDKAFETSSKLLFFIKALWPVIVLGCGGFVGGNNISLKKPKTQNPKNRSRTVEQWPNIFFYGVSRSFFMPWHIFCGITLMRDSFNLFFVHKSPNQLALLFDLFSHPHN